MRLKTILKLYFIFFINLFFKNFTFLRIFKVSHIWPRHICLLPQCLRSIDQVCTWYYNALIHNTSSPHHHQDHHWRQLQDHHHQARVEKLSHLMWKYCICSCSDTWERWDDREDTLTCCTYWRNNTDVWNKMLIPII